MFFHPNEYCGGAAKCKQPKNEKKKDEKGDKSEKEPLLKNQQEFIEGETIDVQYKHIEGDIYVKTVKTICKLSKLQQKALAETRNAMNLSRLNEDEFFTPS
jgi:hypothetical protein